MSSQSKSTFRSLTNSRVSVTRGDVTVEKCLDTSYDEFVGIDVTIDSQSDRALLVSVYETVPDQIDEGDVGFHPGFDPENWSNNGDILRYQAVIEPDEERRTLYAVRDTDLRALRSLMGPPFVRIATQ